MNSENVCERDKTGQKLCLKFIVKEPAGLLCFMLNKISGKSRNNIKSILSHREVTVDGSVVTQFDYNLQPGQMVCIDKSARNETKFEALREIIFEDDDFIVINKPSGLVSVATDNEQDNTAYSIINDYVKQKKTGNRIYVIHRLDRETSGVLIFSKNEKIKLALQAEWSSLVTDRCYSAVVEGVLKEKNGRIKTWLKQTKTLLVYSSSKAGDGLEAVTNYRVIRENEKYSLLDIHLETGRKNQIRVHMKELGHSVVGDKKYGAQTNPLKRLALHACRLEFVHPFSGIKMIFEAPVPAEFISLI